MDPRRHDRPRTRQALTLGAVGLLLSSCAAFHPQRIEVASRVTKTLPPEAVAPGARGAAIPGSGSKTVFVPGRSGAQGGKANYASSPGVTASTINLGIIVPLDGPAAELGKPLYRATQAYVNALNARGGIHGRLVQLFLQTACINCEDENLLAAKALVEQKHVFAVVNTYMNTYAFGAAINYLNQQHVPLIQGWTGIGPESQTWSASQTPWNVYFTVRNEDAVEIYADWLDTVMSHWAQAGKLPFPGNPHWVATVGLDVTQDRKRAAEFKRVWEARGAGYKVVTQQYVAAQEEVVTRMDSFISAMKNAQANGAFSASNITMVFGMQAARRNSWTVPWVSKSAWGKAATDNCGAACNGGFTDNNGWGWSGIRTPQMIQYLATMQRYYPQGATYADAQTLGGWIGMMAFEYAATQLGADLTRPALMNILVSLHNFDTGIGAPITTSSADHLGMGQTMMLQICNNRFWRMTGWLSAGGPMDRVSNKGDCGWGY
jgi:ABC-type branched-subunit amino acid transport system substrate-binding protein